MEKLTVRAALVADRAAGLVAVEELQFTYLSTLSEDLDFLATHFPVFAEPALELARQIKEVYLDGDEDRDLCPTY